MASADLKPILGRPESHARALTKAVTWRAIGTADTFLWGWLITGHPASAGMIASLETFTKIALYYFHERIWRLLPWAPAARTRSLAKAICWRFVGGLDTFILSMLVTGNAKYSISLVGIEALTKIVLYYVHERIWRKVAWGRFDAADEAELESPETASAPEAAPAKAVAQSPG